MSRRLEWRISKREWQIAIKLLIGAFLHFSLATATIIFTSNGDDLATLWPANAVLVAMMLQLPSYYWRHALVTGLLANVAANFVTHGSIITALFGIPNMLEVFIVVWGLRNNLVSEGILRGHNSLGRFLLWAGLIGPSCSSILGATIATLSFGQPFPAAIQSWYVADALGLLVFLPFFNALLGGHFVKSFRNKCGKQRFESIALQALVLATAIGVFSTQHLPILFLVPIPIMLVTFRLGWLGTKISVMLVAVVVAVAAVYHTGPIMLIDVGRIPHNFFAQFYLASLLLMQMPVAAALHSRTLLTKELARNESSTRMLAEQAEILMLSLDRKGQFTRIIGASQKLIGKDKAELIGQSFDVLAPEIGDRLRSGFREIMDYDCFDQALEFVTSEERNLWCEARFRVLEADKLADFEVILTIQDITDRKRRERELVEQAHIDGMTGLLNRAGFTDHAQRKLAQSNGADVHLVMIDVDRFKLINDNLGHAAGDAVLITIAQKMKRQLRSTDTIGRLGGDEFVIVLSNLSPNQAQDACERLVASIAGSPVDLPDGKTVNVNISCGVARWTGGQSLEQLKHNADMALYQAKRGGRNKAVAA